MIYGGKYGWVGVGVALGTITARWKFGKWSLSIDGDDPEITNFESGGFYEDTEGIEMGTLTLNGPYDAGNMPLTRGVIYLFHCGIGGGLYLPVNARVRTLVPSQDVKGKSELQVTARSQGPYQKTIV